ncbi:MAG: hypothetical protein B1H04_05980 [Planctomycetales bacterium 4484_123]|nr:MAG: hypothetical protein B1H04_05980 [Planctomycetales bacterium 4484_123]
MADQLRRDVLGCYGAAFGATANLDRLANESAVFHRHTVNCPLCVPSRISLVTGSHPHVNGAVVNASASTVPTSLAGSRSSSSTTATPE